MNGKNSKFNNSPRVQERDLKERASTYSYSHSLINCVTARTVEGKIIIIIRLMLSYMHVIYGDPNNNSLFWS